jgi:hypothetical protein
MMKRLASLTLSMTLVALAEAADQSMGNQVLSLDGTNSYVSVPHSPELSPAEALTVECWIYVAQPTFGYYIDKGDNIGSATSRSYDFAWHPPPDVDRLDAGLFLGQSTYVAMSVPAQHGQWFHYAMTFDSASGVIKGYINGQLKSTVITDYNKGLPFAGMLLRQTSFPLLFGRNETAPLAFGNGYMDEVRIWNSVRSAQDIGDNMFRSLSGSESNLVAYWNFDDGTATDLTGHGHNGTFNGHARTIPMSLPEPPPAVDLTNGLIAYYPLDGDARDATGNGNGGTLHGAVPGPDRFGNTNGAVYFNGDGAFLSAALHNAPLGNSDRTMTVWFKSLSGNVDMFPAFIGYGSENCTNKSFGIGGSGHQLYFWGGCDDAVSNLRYTDNAWHLASMVYQEDAVRCYLDGQEATSFTANPGAFVAHTNQFRRGPLNTVAGPLIAGSFSPWSIWFWGYMDDIRLYSRALSQQENLALYQETVARQNPELTWATPAEIVYGTPLGPGQLDASVAAAGTLTYIPPVGTVLSAGSNQVLQVVFTPADATQYTAATNAVLINVLKAPQTITFDSIPDHQIGDPPILLHATASSGLPVAFTVRSGPATITGNLLSLGSTNGLVTVSAVQPGDNNYNAVEVDQSFYVGTIPLPSITTQPVSQSVYPGDRVSFTVTATNGPLNYQWQFFQSNLAGETAPTLVLTRVQAAQGGPYHVIVSNPSGSVTSLVANLTVIVSQGTARILQQPRDQAIRLGESATLSVLSAGDGPLLYQWYQGQSGDTTGILAGATNSIYTASGLATNAMYWVSVGNSLGTVDSATASVTVFPANAAKLQLHIISALPGLIIDGIAGTTYRIEYSTGLPSTNWTPVTDLSLATSPFTFIDSGGLTGKTKFYRVVVP